MPLRLRSWFTGAFLVVLLALPASAAWAQKRVALVIGNNAYPGAFALKNPVNDARLMGRMLKDDLGFDVAMHIDLGRTDLYDKTRELLERGKGADVVLVYYSGHALQGPGGNYIVPVDARIRGYDDIRRDARPTTDIVEILQATGARVAILILDACRDYPFGKGGTKGLMRGEAAGNVLVAYATEEGRTATEGAGQYSPYAKALAAHLKRTDITVLHALDEVATAVRRETDEAQHPWRSGNLRHDTCLLPGRCNVYAPTPDQQAAVAQDAADDDAQWNVALASSDLWRYLKYQVQFPKGRTIEEARKRAGIATRTRSGCALREMSPLPEGVELDWKGSCVEGLADGSGTKIYRRDGVITTEWQAGFARGIPVGKWVGTFPLTTGVADRKEVRMSYDRNGELARVMKIVNNDGSGYEGETNATTLNPLSGKPHGKGKIKFTDGGEYEGEFVEGKRDGHGTHIPRLAGGTTAKFVGSWKDGVYSGQGTMTYVDGATYTGGWVNGKREGLGKLTSPRGDTTEGEWIAGQPVRATVVYPRSDNPEAPARYVGSLQDMMFSGMGLMTFAGGSTYEGMWQHGKRHGRGKYISQSEQYEGEWEANVRHGQGQLTRKTNEPGAMVKYVGLFRHNVPSGRGVLEWANGARYDGEVVDGRPHGYGEMRRPDGGIMRGTFDKSRPIGEAPR